ncbi:CAP domain-containing protein [Nannocystaceae bacterium ST9]
MHRVGLLGLSCSLGLLVACFSGIEDDADTSDFGDELGTDGSEGAATSDADTSTTGDGDTSMTTTTAGEGDTTSTTTGDGDGDTTTTTGDGDTGNPDNPYDAAAQHCVDTINMYRATLDLPPYERWIEAEVCSGEEAQSDSMTQTPHGAFGQCGEWAQNECPGWPGPPEQLLDGCLAQMWAEGPGEPFSEHGHYINMSSTQYTKVACGFYQTGQGDYWAVQNFQ